MSSSLFVQNLKGLRHFIQQEPRFGLSEESFCFDECLKRLSGDSEIKIARSIGVALLHGRIRYELMRVH